MMDSGFTRAEKRLVLTASCLAIFINPLAGSMTNLALGAIQGDFHCSEHELGWITSIYFIISVMVMLPAAKLSDIYGKKRMFMMGAVIAAIGLILSSFSQSIQQLYVLRGVTAVGMAFISSTSVSMISDVYAPHERGGAIGINTACVYLGASLGPTLGGVLTEHLGWRSIFIVLVPFAVLAFLALMGFHYNIKSTPDKKLDSKGTVVYMVGILIAMFGLISLPELYAVIMLIVGSVILAVFIRMETKVDNPIFKGSLFKNSRFSRSMLALFLNYAASFCITFFLSRYLQEIGAMTPTQAGILLMVQPIVQVILTLICGKLSDKVDKRILPTAGMVIQGVGIAMLFFLEKNVNVPLMIAALAVIGFGYGMFSAANVNAIMSYVDKSDYNATSGLISTARQTGMMLSMGLATCLIAIFMGTNAILAPENYDTFMDVMRTAWIICFSFAFVGAVVSWFRGSESAE